MNNEEGPRQAALDAIETVLGTEAPLLAPVVRPFFSEADDVELSGRTANDLGRAFRAHLALGQTRAPHTGLVRVVTATTDAGTGPGLVVVVTDDMPFLVDSILLAIRSIDFDAELVLHPILHAHRDSKGTLTQALSSQPTTGTTAESWIMVELDRLPTEHNAVELEAAVQRSLADVRSAVADWLPMQARAKELAATLHATPHSEQLLLPVDEAGAFLGWLANGNFTFLGAIDHRLEDGVLVPIEATALGLLRAHHDGSSIEQVIAPSADWSPLETILVTKTIAHSTVHRPGQYDIIVIKSYSPGSNIATGERRIVGLFTSAAYLLMPQDIPLIRRKVQAVLDRSGLAPASHSGKALRSILASHPRDELFATTIDELSTTSQGILSLGERRRTRLFSRFDAQRSAWICQVFVPRDRYTTEVRRRVQSVLERSYGASTSSYDTQLTDSRLARIVVTLPVPASAAGALPQHDEVEAEVILAARFWDDALADALRATPTGGALIDRFVGAFPPAYTAETPIAQATEDAAWVERSATAGQLMVRLHRNTAEDITTADARLSVYCPSVDPTGRPNPKGLSSSSGSMALADLLPVLSHLGLRVIDEKADEVLLRGSDNAGSLKSVWIHDLGVCGDGLATADPNDELAQRICSAVPAILAGEIDSDSFNQLVLAAGLGHRQVAVLRLYARHARQLGLSFSLDYIASALAANPTLAASLVARFESMFDPAGYPDASARRMAVDQLRESFLAAVADVPSLEHDRLLRFISAQMDASVRTNYYQPNRPVMAVKFETQRLLEAPLPRPRFEIFVSGPQVEGVHLRMGAVARGGLRWSDRHEDFRTEVLGLMKAQAVKNAIIVPAGAKGGFVVRRPSGSTDRSVVQAEGIACYRLFIGALLDVTDNLVGGEVAPAPHCVRWDTQPLAEEGFIDGDSYLVVAADKGTATFSDIANEISLVRGHWLGDAFASGGSVGYDHKAMGITARGAWESVKRHFLRTGRNISTPDAAPFSVVGVGDMSGDVFGNGVLLSERMALVAAFDHRHVFIDPNPDPMVSFEERKRLFALDRSSWDDYDRSKISAGGGVWPRSAKSIALSDAARTAIGVEPGGAGATTDLTPTEVISAILRAPVDLLWNGGIGTYVKASTETHQQVGDKANDLVRADATELRCAIVGEGGNLGVTQRGRIEFAARLSQEPAGTIGWINTDAIDNSAGVDTSDHEVNLKILLDRAVVAGSLSGSDRNTLLASMTDEVAQHVLADNVDQNRLLGLLRSESSAMAELHRRYVTHLESTGRLDRALEALPSDESFAHREASGEGLTIPELAVLVAHTKLAITEDLAGAKLADEQALAAYLTNYFPASMRDRFADGIATHPLRHEILAMVLANRVVNRNGITFVFRMEEETNASVSDIVRAHTAASTILDVDSYWESISKLDGTVADNNVTALLLEADRAVERVTRWLLRNRALPLDVEAAVRSYGPGLAELASVLDDVAAAASTPGSDGEALTERTRRLGELGCSPALARQAAQFEFATGLLDAVAHADGTDTSAAHRRAVASIHLALDDELAIGRLRRRILRLPRDDRWDALARAAMRDDLATEHLALTKRVLDHAADGGSVQSGAVRVREWADTRRQRVSEYLEIVAGTEGADPTLAQVSVVLRNLRTLGVDTLRS
jgi:glutamate dehydrogenase